MIIKTTSVFVLYFFILVLSVTSCQSEQGIKQQQYISEGLALYEKHCANCHQSDGKGLASLYPSITNSISDSTRNKIICGIRYGIHSGKYSQAMPPNTELKPLDIAMLVTFLNDTWGKPRMIQADQVSKVLLTCETKK